jgi:U-box domain
MITMSSKHCCFCIAHTQPDKAALEALKKQRLQVELGLPGKENSPNFNFTKSSTSNTSSTTNTTGSSSSTATADSATSDVPTEFLCAINSHIMKQPVRSPHGHVFEKSTILLWLETRGRVCPLTGKTLTADELTTDEELRSRIMRWHIQRTSMNVKPVLEGVSVCLLCILSP